MERRTDGRISIMEFQQDPLSLSVACHIGAGALAVAWTHKIDD